MIGLGRPSHIKSTRHPRQSSSAAYSVFDSNQIQTFREAFNLIDQDGDGFITAKDLQGTFDSLGKLTNSTQITALLKTDSINFTLFITMMAEKLSELDTENDLFQSFATLDRNDDGYIDGDDLRLWLKEGSDGMSEAEITKLLNGPFSDKKGRFNYREFTQTLRVTDVDDDEALANSKK